MRRALVAWGFGHLVLGATGIGVAWLTAEVVALLLVAWLTIGLADSSLHLVPFLAGTAFIVAWAWQAVDAYRRANRLLPARPPTPERSPAAAIGWLSLPLLAWGAGFWLIAADAATPAAVLDRFVRDWGRQDLDAWPPAIRREADAAAGLGFGAERFRDLRVRIVESDRRHATAVAEAVHFERRAARFLGVFAGSELVPVADEVILTLDLAARPVELPGGGDLGAVQWELVAAHR